MAVFSSHEGYRVLLGHSIPHYRSLFQAYGSPLTAHAAIVYAPERIIEAPNRHAEMMIQSSLGKTHDITAITGDWGEVARAWREGVTVTMTFGVWRVDARIALGGIKRGNKEARKWRCEEFDDSVYVPRSIISSRGPQRQEVSEGLRKDGYPVVGFIMFN